MGERNFTDEDIAALGEAIAAAIDNARALEEKRTKCQKILAQFDEAKERYDRAHEEWDRLWKKHRPQRTLHMLNNRPYDAISIDMLDYEKHCPPWRTGE